MLLRAISSGVERLPYKEEVAGSNPASPTYKTPAKELFFVGKERGPGYASRPFYRNLTATRLERAGIHSTRRGQR
jgi:hypothetical protein